MWRSVYTFSDFEALSWGTIFGAFWGSWGTTLASVWWPFGARVHSGGPLSVPGWIFDEFRGVLGASFGDTFAYFLIFAVICGVKKHVWVAGTDFDDF